MTDIFPERAPAGQNIEGESADRLPVKWSFLIGHHAYHAAQAVLAVRDHGAAGKERHDHVTMAEERLFRSHGYGLANGRNHAHVADPSQRSHLPAPSRGLRSAGAPFGHLRPFILPFLRVVRY